LAISFTGSGHGENEHKIKANHDKEVADFLLNTRKYPDWVVTCSFYIALHCVDAFAHRNGIRTFDPGLDEDITAHRKRELYVRKDLKTYFNIYKKLHDRSNQARYDPKYFQLIPTYLPAQMVKLAEKFLALL
jgi:hypothetical protein